MLSSSEISIFLLVHCVARVRTKPAKRGSEDSVALLLRFASTSVNPHEEPSSRLSSLSMHITKTPDPTERKQPPCVAHPYRLSFRVHTSFLHQRFRKIMLGQVRKALCFFLVWISCTAAFCPIGRPSTRPSASLSAMVDPSELVQVASAIDTSMIIAETEAWVKPTAAFLDPFLNIMSFAMLARVVLSWYPTTKSTDFPWVLLVIPTEPLLRAVRGVIPPAFGVDITPIAWLGLFTFIHEIMLGQQGLLTMKIKYGI